MGRKAQTGIQFKPSPMFFHLLLRRLPYSPSSSIPQSGGTASCISSVKPKGIQTHAIKSVAMISVLAQERLLGAALGSILTGVVVFEERKRIYRSISDEDIHGAIKPQMKEPMFGKKSRSELAHLWNRTVDKTLGPIIESLSSRGW